MATSIYNATGDKPTNADAFEDITENDYTQSADILENELKVFLGSETAIASACSIVGSIIWQSWKNRASAKPETNLFVALTKILEESSKTTSQVSSGTSSRKGYFDRIFDKLFGNEEEDILQTLVNNIDTNIAKIKQWSVDAKDNAMLNHLQSIDTLLNTWHAKGNENVADASIALELILDALIDIKTAIEEKPTLAQHTTQSASLPILQSTNSFANTVDMSNAFSNLISMLSTLSDGKKSNMYKGIITLTNVVAKLEELTPRLEKVLVKTVDIVIQVGTKIKDNANAIDQFNNLALSLEKFVQSLSNIGGALTKTSIALVAFAGSIFAVGYMMTSEVLLGFAGFSIVLWGFLKIFQTFDGKELAKIATGLTLFSTSIALLALTVSLIPGAVGIEGIVMLGLLGATMAGTIWLIRQANPQQFGKEVMLISASIATLVLAATVGGAMMAENWESALTVVGFIVLFGGALWLANKLMSSDNRKLGISVSGDKGAAYAALGIAASIAVLALSIWSWHQLVPDWTYAVAPALTMVAFGVVLMGLGKTVGANGKQIGMAVLMTTASIGLLALSIWVWKEMNFTMEDLLLPATAIFGLVTALSMLNKYGNSGEGSIQSAAVSLIVASAAILVLAGAMWVWKESGVTMDDVVNFGAFTAVVATTLGVLSKYFEKDPKSLLLGATAMVIMGGAMVVFAYSLKLIGDIDYGKIWNFYGFVAASVGLALGIGATGVGAAAVGLGAAALIGVGAAMAIFAASVKMIGAMDINWNFVEPFQDFIKSSIDTALSIGGPIKSIKLGVGAASLVVLGTAILQFSKALKAVSELNLTPTQITGIGKSLSSFIGSMIAALQDNEDKLEKAEDGIDALADLGDMLYNLAYGIQGIAELRFPKYGVKDGKLVVTGTLDIEEQLPKIGDSIGALLTALTGPLSQIGQDAGFLKKSSVQKGIEALTGIGDIFYNMAQGLQIMAEMKFPKYGVDSEGKLIITGMLDAKVMIPEIASNMKTLLDTLATQVFAPIGAQKNAFWQRTDVSKGIDALEDIGNILDPVANFLSSMSEVSGKYVDGALSLHIKDAISGVIDATKLIGSAEFDYAKIDENTNVLSKTMQVISSAKINSKAKDMVEFSDALSKVQTSINNLNLTKLTQFSTQVKSLQNKSIIDAINGLAQSINGPLTAALEQLFAKLEAALEKFGKSKKSASSSEPLSNVGLLERGYQKYINDKNSTSTNSALSFDTTYVNPEDAGFAEIYSILVQIHEALTTVGIRTFN